MHRHNWKTNSHRFWIAQLVRLNGTIFSESKMALRWCMTWCVGCCLNKNESPKVGFYKCKSILLKFFWYNFFFSYVVSHELCFKITSVAKNLTIQKSPFCRRECGHVCQTSPFSNKLLVHNQRVNPVHSGINSVLKATFLVAMKNSLFRAIQMSEFGKWVKRHNGYHMIYVTSDDITGDRKVAQPSRMNATKSVALATWWCPSGWVKA